VLSHTYASHLCLYYFIDFYNAFIVLYLYLYCLDYVSSVFRFDFALSVFCTQLYYIIWLFFMSDTVWFYLL